MSASAPIACPSTQDRNNSVNIRPRAGISITIPPSRLREPPPFTQGRRGFSLTLKQSFYVKFKIISVGTLEIGFGF